MIFFSLAIAGGVPAHVARCETLVYSFEGAMPLDGFYANGAGLSLAQDTVGATHGMHSLRVVVGPGSFVGALTEFLPAAVGDPPGIDYVLFDLTLSTEFQGAFAVIGVSIFGHSQPDQPGGQVFGLQTQFMDEVHLDGLASETYRDIRIDLDQAFSHPLTFEPGKSFNDIFGTLGSGPDDLIPSGFELYFNKPPGTQLTVYVDNIRVVAVPEPELWFLASSGVFAGFLARRRTNVGSKFRQHAPVDHPPYPA